MKKPHPYVALLRYLSSYSYLSDIQLFIYKKWLLSQYRTYKSIIEFQNLSDSVKEDFFNEKKVSFFSQEIKLERSPFYLPDIHPALSVLKEISSRPNYNIVIYGDRDADGISSTSSIYIFLKNYLNISDNNLKVLFPLKEDKYGITEEVAYRIIKSKPNVLFILDCGSANKDTIETIKKEHPRILIVIIDHHFLHKDEKNYPSVSAFINPKRLPVNFSERDLCTSVLVYKLIAAFIFSYTSEFNRIYEVSAGVYIKNGCLIDVVDTTLDNIISYSHTKLFLENIRKNHIFFRKTPQVLQEKISLKQEIWFFQLSHLHKYLERLKVFIPFAAIGTIADMMPVSGDNKILISEGLKQIKVSDSIFLNGLRALLKLHNLAGEYTPILEQDVSFLIAPSINAAGRLGVPETAFEVLVCQDPLEGLKKASSLVNLNTQRKEFSKKAFLLLQDKLYHQDNQNKKLAIYYHKDIHRGISGLLANKLSQLLKKATIVMVEDGAYIRGSIRSYEEENVLDLLHLLEKEFIQYGGHTQAAGFSLEKENLEHFTQLVLKKASSNWVIQKPRMIFRAPVFHLTENTITLQKYSEILRLSPYGIKAPHPVIKLQILKSCIWKYLGTKKEHIRVEFQAMPHCKVEAVGFFVSPEDIQLLEKASFLLVEPHYNYFQNKRRHQFKILKYIL